MSKISSTCYHFDLTETTLMYQWTSQRDLIGWLREHRITWTHFLLNLTSEYSAISFLSCRSAATWRLWSALEPRRLPWLVPTGQISLCTRPHARSNHVQKPRYEFEPMRCERSTTILPVEFDFNRSPLKKMWISCKPLDTIESESHIAFWNCSFGRNCLDLEWTWFIVLEKSFISKTVWEIIRYLRGRKNIDTIFWEEKWDRWELNYCVRVELVFCLR